MASLETLENRVIKLEELSSDLVTGLNRCVSLNKLNGLLTILQAEQDALLTQVNELIGRIELLEKEPYS